MNSNLSNINNNIKINININNNNIYNYEHNKSNSKNTKKILDNSTKDGKQLIKINNVNTKTKPINIFSNKSHYIPVSNNTSNNVKANSKGKSTKKSNDINIGKKITHPSSATGPRPINNNNNTTGYMRKTVKIGSNISSGGKSGNFNNINNVPSGKYQPNKNGKITTASILNNKRMSTKLKK